MIVVPVCQKCVQTVNISTLIMRVLTFFYTLLTAPFRYILCEEKNFVFTSRSFFERNFSSEIQYILSCLNKNKIGCCVSLKVLHTADINYLIADLKNSQVLSIQISPAFEVGCTTAKTWGRFCPSNFGKSASEAINEFSRSVLQSRLV